MGRTFRGMFAAASLKRNSSVPWPHGIGTFRGMFAAASLKQPHHQPQRKRDLDFPRHVCRGLIEARRIARPAMIRDPTFRGMFAAASLKRGMGPLSNLIGMQTFRGMFAAASLKLHCTVIRLSSLNDFPRHVCRGLIEATTSQVHRPETSNFPRHVCRGLIEA